MGTCEKGEEKKEKGEHEDRAGWVEQAVLPSLVTCRHCLRSKVRNLAVIPTKKRAELQLRQPQQQELQKVLGRHWIRVCRAKGWGAPYPPHSQRTASKPASHRAFGDSQ